MLCFINLTVSKNLIPYSSAKAWPFAVGIAWEKIRSMHQRVYYYNVMICKWRFTTYPFAFIHVSFVTDQYFVDIIRGMLLYVLHPVPYVCHKTIQFSLKMIYSKIDLIKIKIVKKTYCWRMTHRLHRRQAVYPSLLCNTLHKMDQNALGTKNKQINCIVYL